MDYQEIVTKYKTNSLVTNNLRKKLEIAKPLDARPRYSILDLAARSWYYYSSIVDLLTVKETPKRLEFFEKNSKIVISQYFNEIVERIKQAKAWNFMGINARDFSKEKFEEATISEKFSMIYELNQKYCKFLEYQKLADLRDVFVDKTVEPDEQTLRKMCFLKMMFVNFKSENVKREFFCFDEHFLHALLKYRNSKDVRLEDHMKNQKKSISNEYKKFEDLKFFTTEDYRDIIENINLVCGAAKLSRTQVMRIYAQMAETEAEQEDLNVEMKNFKDLEVKVQKMSKLKTNYEKERVEIEKRERAQKQIEEERRRLEEEKRNAEELKKRQEEERLKAEQERKIGTTEGYTEELDRKISKLQNTPTVKETVIPVIFIWLDKEKTTLTQKIGNQKLAVFFSKLRKIEEKTGDRVSLFLITNANQETTKKRVEELRKKSKNAGMPRIVEGALGGYSSFRVDEEGNVKDVAKMSPENRDKIELLIERSIFTSFPKSIIDETEQNYIRYKFSDKPDKSITKQYLTMLIGRLLNDERVKRQPLRFMPFIEPSATGVDVLLESQIKGISKIYEYYESKYFISPGKSYKVNAESIDQFLEEKDKKEEGR